MSCFCKPCWQRTSDSLFASDCTVSQMVCAPDFVSAVQPLLGLSGRAGTAPPGSATGHQHFLPERKGAPIWDQLRWLLFERMQSRMADGPWSEQAGKEGSWGDRCPLHTCLANWYKELFRFIQGSLEEKRCTLFLALAHIRMPARPVQMQAAGPRA